jgi:cobalt/nickel transport system permease protein
MADALLSPAVGGTMYAVSGAALAYSVVKIKNTDLSDKKVPIMAVSGAMVFTAQMINFTIPATGSSGHIGGGMLLAALLGGGPALIALACVLAIQCLFFADGGLLALGANIFNMGVIPCLLIYPLIYKPIVKGGMNKIRITIASIIAVIVSLQIGAFAVVLETMASGITELPFSSFIILMQPIHLAIGIVEGIVTALIVSFVHSARPEILDQSKDGRKLLNKVKTKTVVITLGIFTLVVGGVVSLFASSHPDGLEWSIAGVTGDTELATKGTIFDAFASLQEKLAFLPDYDFAHGGIGGISGTTVSGIIGALITFAIAGIIGLSISIYKKKHKREY